MQETDQGAFEKTVAEIVQYAFNYGIDQMGEFDRTSDSTEDRVHFIELCHEGYGLAQERILGKTGHRSGDAAHSCGI